MKQLFNNFAWLLAMLVSIVTLFFFLSIDGPIRMPVILIWIPELFGWEVFSALMAMSLGSISYLFFKGDKHEQA